MIYKFRFISGEEENFIRDIDIQYDQTFLDLHIALQKSVGYDSSILASFFITDDSWLKEKEITLVEMEDDNPIMEESVIIDFITKDKQKLLYVFDYFNERTFFAELIEKYESNGEHDFPKCSFKQGEAPPQLMQFDTEI
jgi:pRiA4b ORF-3-like protein